MNASDLPAVLYVDDDALNLRVFDANFGQRFRIFRCSSPNEALALLEQRRAEIGVVLSDQRMPGMTGVELLERARSIAPDARRMLVTAYADMQAVIDAVNRGQVTRYFVKPWDRAELLAALEDALKIARLELRIREVEGRMMKSERLATLGQVTAGIAHELMGPVGYLTQNVSSLQRDMERVVQYVSRHLLTDPDAEVSSTIEDLPSLIKDLSEGATHLRGVALGLRAQARGEDMEATAEVAEVVSFAVKLARAEVRDRARLTSSGEPIRIVFGPVKLCQVLLNLIVNAAQAMEGTGRPGRIDVRWAARDEDVVLTVSDNGCGIPLALQEKVFQPLFTTKPVGIGTGLGLSICRELVMQFGGQLRLSSTPGEGTEIELTFKRAPLP
ncbi:hybrid sensor histidine kinase/response regulator [Corallococcus sp. AB049A]|uniref:histidine kinase n=1 Tax=Corallococcus interemptor TaxID=2316720 RepID=A0A3A8R4T7_9BACT|nr:MULTISPECIES: hybrid sensor histidine kinase/response regulator [Corallococcus]RKH53245.1 hybrid sensor histidine kinase/response regulator [Corallococcus sp. AB050B]RKH73855.1 hybrid sensor histidine kinase/response regulator [Corallococcus interemptor]RKI72444.1 hybrid sensor histidine kinase/response regulator [Corallococcus sp. AB049A]